MSGEHHDGVEPFPRIASTIVHKRWWVSTIKMPINLAPQGRIPLYYETAVFDLTVWDQDTGETVLTRRYPDESSARRGHRRVVKKIRKDGYPTT